MAVPFFSLKGASCAADGSAIVRGALKNGARGAGLALKVWTEMGAGQLVQICIKRPGHFAIAEGFSGQNGANDIVKTSARREIGQYYADKRAFGVSSDPCERSEKYKFELTVQGGLARNRRGGVGSELPTPFETSKMMRCALDYNAKSPPTSVETGSSW